MNSRQRILSAMQCRPVDRIPFVPCLNGYNIVSMPKRFHDMPRWEILKDLGIDLLIRFRLGVFVKPPMVIYPPSANSLPLAQGSWIVREWENLMRTSDQVKVEMKEDGDDRTIMIDTPVGRVQYKWRFTKASLDIPFPIEPMIKTVDDIDVFHFILDNTIVEPAYDEIHQTLDAVGDEGTCEATGGPTPIQDLLEILAGVENFYRLYFAHQKKMEDLMDHMLEVRKCEYELLAKSPAPIVITGENTSTTICSPTFMAQYEFPALNTYSDILHNEDKIHMVHMCGRLHHAMDELTGCRFDGAHDVAPPPTGDFDFKADRERFLASGKCISGGIDATAFAFMSPEKLEDYIIKRLEQVAPGTGFLMGSGDTVPYGTTEENLRTVVKVLEKYGKSPISVT